MSEASPSAGQSKRWGYALAVGLAVLLLLGAGLAWQHTTPSSRPISSPAATAVAPTATPTPTVPPRTASLHVKAAPVFVRPAAVISETLVLPDGGPTAASVILSRGAYSIPPLPHVITYTVRPGDTLSSIALHFGVSLDALRWSNPKIEHDPDDLYPGDVLRIPPVNGVVVAAKQGDTIERLARRYHVPPEVIRDYAANRLRPPYTLKPGQLIVIPGGHKVINVKPPQPHPGYAYMWPARGVITQGFTSHHHGVDIAGPYGTYVYAARSGRVRVVRWDDTGYGYMVIIDHGGGWNTLYAHLKGALVQPGQWVRQGQIIGRMGGTGRATGPHVHFEIRKGRVRYNPMQFLPPTP